MVLSLLDLDLTVRRRYWSSDNY
jgi:hypothetical protein